MTDCVGYNILPFHDQFTPVNETLDIMYNIQYWK